MSVEKEHFKYGIEEVPFLEELKPLLEEIRYAVSDVRLSTITPSHLASYFNLEIKEGRRMCVMMSREGFKIVGSDYDRRDLDKGQCYETINALLDELSPEYRKLFSEALADKLRKLKQ